MSAPDAPRAAEGRPAAVGAPLVGAQLGPDAACAVLVAPPGGSGGRASVLHVERASGASSLEAVLRGVLGAAARAGAQAPAPVVLDVGPLLEHLLTRAPERLSRVAVVRVVPRPASDPALERHSSDLVEALVRVRAVVPGGHDVLGRELRLLDRPALARALAVLADAGPDAAAVVGAGSTAAPAHEREVADAVQAVLPAARISVAHDFGGHGGAAREATVVLDAALGATVDRLVERARTALAAGGRRGRAPAAVLRLVRGDGGSLSAERARSAPVLVVGGSLGLQVLGAAHLAGQRSCRVLLPGGSSARGGRGDGSAGGDDRGGHLVGGVRSGLVLVRPLRVGDPPTELVVPAAALQTARSHHLARAVPVPGQVPDVLADRPPDELACVGAALARPLAWLDEIFEITSADDLAVLRRAAVQRATALATANGADPGSADVTEVSAVAVPYSRAGTVRVQVRVGGSGRS